MTKREILIRKRAAELFSAENIEPDLRFEAEFAERNTGAEGIVAISETVRNELMFQAEKQLIEEGTIESL